MRDVTTWQLTQELSNLRPLNDLAPKVLLCSGVFPSEFLLKAFYARRCQGTIGLSRSFLNGYIFE